MPIQTLSPLTDSSVDNTLLQTAPNVNQSLYAFVDIVDLHLIHTQLHDSPNLVINEVQLRAVGGHSSGEMKSGVSRCTRLCHVPDAQVRCPAKQEARLPQSTMLVNSCYVSRVMRVIQVSNNESGLQCHSKALAMVLLDRPHTIYY